MSDSENSSEIGGEESSGPVKYVLDATAPANDKIFDTSAFEKFCHDKIKVDGKTGNLGDRVVISREGDRLVIVSQSEGEFSGRYLKYLTKKFLKKNQLRDWLQVISNGDHQYELKFFNVVLDEEDEEDEDED